MLRVGLLSVLLTSSVARPVMAQAGSASALDSVRVAVHPFCQVRRCPPYFMVLRANGELTLAQDSAHTSIQLADSTVAHLLAIVHPVMRSTLPARIADSRMLCNMVMTHQGEVIVELYAGAAMKRIVDSHVCQDMGDNSKDVEGWIPVLRRLRAFEAELQALPRVLGWLKR